MLFKQGVTQLGMGKPMRKFLGALEGVAKDFVVTSTSADLHRADSCHYTGDAADLRKATFYGKKLTVELLRSVARAVERELGAKAGSFDIVDEGDHLHVEWDPK